MTRFTTFGDCAAALIRVLLVHQIKQQKKQTLIILQFSISDAKQSFSFAVISFILNT